MPSTITISPMASLASILAVAEDLRGIFVNLQAHTIRPNLDHHIFHRHNPSTRTTLRPLFAVVIEDRSSGRRLIKHWTAACRRRDTSRRAAAQRARGHPSRPCLLAATYTKSRVTVADFHTAPYAESKHSIFHSNVP
ncbi:hypothetical protein AC579_2397 [Pseudocercospora musae]|uniref:Uncharacterized protein n=1 Tax=Pseudocercospora musae TaxID=113226 RepID=A0A139IGV6_9PEZI|nr:hypothetical protein AC579_2397 [Pseudocercospora musae]